MTTPTVEPSIRVFLSYAHADDVVLEFIEPFITSLKHMAFADRGRTLETFVDRESIGWGENWKEQIRNSIESATVFIPVITRQYFDRPACREELLLYYNQAKQFGVDALLLPVVVMGHSYITDDNADVAVRIVHERQYRDMKEAWLEGPQSSTWRRVLMKLANELVDAADLAERRLGKEDKQAGTQAVVDSDDDPPGSADVAEALERFQNEIKHFMELMGASLARFAEAMPSAAQLEGIAQPEFRKIILDVAAQLEPHGIEFQDTAQKFESATVEIDSMMRGYASYLRKNNLSEILEREREAALGIDADYTAPFVQTEQIISNFLQQIQSLEAGSAPLRRSVRGFRNGARVIKSAISIMLSWPGMFDD